MSGRRFGVFVQSSGHATAGVAAVGTAAFVLYDSCQCVRRHFWGLRTGVVCVPSVVCVIVPGQGGERCLLHLAVPLALAARRVPSTCFLENEPNSRRRTAGVRSMLLAPSVRCCGHNRGAFPELASVPLLL